MKFEAPLAISANLAPILVHQRVAFRRQHTGIVLPTGRLTEATGREVNSY